MSERWTSRARNSSGADGLSRSIEPDTGRVRSVAYEEDIKQSIHIILATAKGERVMRPDFGCGIHDLVFAPWTPP